MFSDNYIVVYDYETGSKDPHTTQPIQLAAVIVDNRKLKPVPGAEFCSMIKAEKPEELEDEALRITGKTREEIASSPLLVDVWDGFLNFCGQYKTGKNHWGNPIPAGHNIVNFDNVISKRVKDHFGSTWPFHPIYHIDTLSLLYCWFSQTQEPSKLNMDYLRDYFGISKDGAHDALNDCRISAQIICRFLDYMRRLEKKTNFKNAFN